MLSKISHAKNTKQGPADLYKAAVNKESEAVAAVFEEYEKALRTANALDFDDLLLEAVRLLQTRRRHARSLEPASELRDGGRVSGHQSQPVRVDAPAHRGRTTTSAWWATRTSRSIAGAARTSAIFWISSAISARPRPSGWSRITAPPRTFWARPARWWRTTRSARARSCGPSADAGDKLGLYAGFDAENEALFIADTIEKHLVANPADHVAVLYRTNFQSRQIEEALRRYGRTYSVVGGFSFYQRAEIKDTVAYLKLAASNYDSVSLLRIINTPARGIGKTTVDQIERYAREHSLSLWNAIERIIDDEQLSTRSQSSLVTFRNLIQELSLVASSRPLPELLQFILDRTGYRKMLQTEKTPESETRLENLDELINAATEAAERGESIGDFLDHAALVADADAVDERAPVTLMTLHNAKGLEFPVVFPGRHGTGPVPAQPLDEFRIGAGGRAAAVLRRHDAGAQEADSHLGAIPPAVWRRRAGAVHALVVPERGAGGSDCRSGAAGRARRSESD